MNSRYCLFGLVLALLLAQRACARETMLLSGEWSFRTDPNDVGRAEKWFAEGARFGETLRVPGAWNAQAVGEPTKALFSGYAGPAWYRKTVSIPENMRLLEVYLSFGGVHRRADVWVNGEFAGSHIGYVSPFRIEITRFVVRKWTADIVVRVDGRRDASVDPLYGCMDLMDMGDVAWGGICGNVWLDTVNRSWIDNVYVRPHVESGVAEVIVETSSHTLYGGSAEPPPEFHFEAEVYDQAGKHVGSGKSGPLLPGMQPDYAMVGIDDVKLWSPKRPYLYNLEVRLYHEGELLDTVSDRFGMRELKVDGDRFLLNGKPIFLRGFGDDCVFPNTIAPPADKSVYLTRLRAAKEYGFNYVRCHSWAPPEEYLDAADELGIMVQPEFPIAYSEFYKASTTELRQFYIDQWREMIKARRGHPSVVTWSMSNEMWGGFDLAQEMYLAAKEIDPTRLVIDSNGVIPLKPGEKPRATLDFLACQFDEPGKMGFHDGKYDLGPWKPTKPVVVHEMGNFGTFPDLGQEMLFTGGVRPYWLSDARALAERKGLTGQLAKWKANSDRLQAIALKTNIEAARRAEGIRGYDQWLLQDYWTGSNGVLDMLYRQKSISAAEFRKFNAPTVLLMESARRSYWMGDTAKVSLLVSRYEDPATVKAKLNWRLMDGGKVVATGARAVGKVPSDGVQKLGDVMMRMPASGPARKLTLFAGLTDSNAKVTNSWDFWVFPAGRISVTDRVCIAGLDRVMKLYPKAGGIDPRMPIRRCDLLVASEMTSATVEYLKEGGKMLLLGAGSLPAVASSYKPYWWLGSSADGNGGTVADSRHPALGAMPKEQWCDLEWYHLLTGSKAVMMDDLPSGIRPIIACIDPPSAMREKAYLFEAKVGRGKLLVASMNFDGALSAGDPAASCLLDQLFRYASGPRFAPGVELPLEYLSK